MSIKLMNFVWENGPDNSTQRFVLLTLADMANDNGLSVYPSMNLIARKCALERRSVIRVINALVEDGYLKRTRRWKGDEPTSNDYEIVLSRIGARPVDDDIPVTTRRSDVKSPPSDTQSLRIANMSPPSDRKSPGSDIYDTTPSDRMSHDPSFLSINEPSINQRGEGSRAPKPEPSMISQAHPAIKAIQAVTSYWPGEVAHDAIIAALGDEPDLPTLQAAYKLWAYNGNKLTNYAGICDWYQELRHDPNWTPQARFKNGKAKTAAPAAAPMKEVAPGLY